jgi:hypothetical protein
LAAIHDRGTVEGWPPPLAVPLCQEMSPLTSWHSPRGRPKPWGWRSAPGAQPYPGNTMASHSQGHSLGWTLPLIRLIDLSLSGLEPRIAGGPAGDLVFKTASMARPSPRPSLRWFPAALRLHLQSTIPHQPELGAAPLGYADSRLRARWRLPSLSYPSAGSSGAAGGPPVHPILVAFTDRRDLRKCAIAQRSAVHL